MNLVYHFFDWFFVVFHTSLIVFNLFGWIFKTTRKLNLITLVLTASSWIILGLFYTIGYCPLTAWHFKILYKLGFTNLPDSYTQYLIERFTGFEIRSYFADIITTAGLIIALAISLYTNIRDRRKIKNKIS